MSYVEGNPYEHTGCGGLFGGGNNDECSVCGEAPMGLQAWLPVRGSPPPPWYMALREDLDAIAPVVDAVIAAARATEGG